MRTPEEAAAPLAQASARRKPEEAVAPPTEAAACRAFDTAEVAAVAPTEATVRGDFGTAEEAVAPPTEATVCRAFYTAEEAAAALAEATVRGDFGGAQRAVERFSKLLVRAAAAVPSGEALRRLDDACSLIEWSRRNLCAARAHVVEEIRRLDSICQYHQRLAVTERGWRG